MKFRGSMMIEKRSCKKKTYGALFQKAKQIVDHEPDSEFKNLKNQKHFFYFASTFVLTAGQVFVATFQNKKRRVYFRRLDIYFNKAETTVSAQVRYKSLCPAAHPKKFYSIFFPVFHKINEYMLTVTYCWAHVISFCC